MLLILVAVEVFVLPSLAAAGVLSVLHLSTAAGLTLIAGVVAVSESLSTALLTGSVSLAAMLTKFIVMGDRSPPARILDATVTMVAAGVLAALILAYVFGKERSTLHRMVGAVAAYLLIAVIFSRVYEIVWLTRPDSMDLGGAKGTYNDLLYFSFATLTTLGYGMPVGPFARALVSVEALVGQLYPAILIARLVSLPGSATKPRHEAP